MDLLVKQDDATTQGYSINIEDATLKNRSYRYILRTYPGSMQLVLMSVPVDGDIPWERHDHNAQFIRVEAGRGMVQMGSVKGRVEEMHKMHDGSAVIVPPGRWHYVRNTCPHKPLKLYTVYCPPVHHHEGKEET